MKKIKYQSDDDDGNFVVVPYKARTKHVESSSTESEGDEVNEQTRVNPKWIVDAIKNFNARQRRTMKDLGFGNNSLIGDYGHLLCGSI